MGKGGIETCEILDDFWMGRDSTFNSIQLHDSALLDTRAREATDRLSGLRGFLRDNCRNPGPRLFTFKSEGQGTNVYLPLQSARPASTFLIQDESHLEKQTYDQFDWEEDPDTEVSTCRLDDGRLKVERRVNADSIERVLEVLEDSRNIKGDVSLADARDILRLRVEAVHEAAGVLDAVRNDRDNNRIAKEKWPAIVNAALKHCDPVLPHTCHAFKATAIRSSTDGATALLKHAVNVNESHLELTTEIFTSSNTGVAGPRIASGFMIPRNHNTSGLDATGMFEDIRYSHPQRGAQQVLGMSIGDDIDLSVRPVLSRKLDWNVMRDELVRERVMLLCTALFMF